MLAHLIQLARFSKILIMSICFFDFACQGCGGFHRLDANVLLSVTLRQRRLNADNTLESAFWVNIPDCWRQIGRSMRGIHESSMNSFCLRAAAVARKA
jgi:hypothetical protein